MEIGLMRRVHAAKGTSPIGTTGWLLLAWVLLSAGVAYLPWLGAGRRTLLELAGVVAPTLAGVLCLRAAAGSQSGRRRWSWWLIAAAMLTTALAEGYSALALRGDATNPSIADVGSLLFYPLAFAALLLMVEDRGKWASWTTSLNSLVFTMGIAGLAWQLIVAPSLEGTTAWAEAAVITLYPSGDLLVIFAVVALILTLRLDRVPLSALFLLAAFTVRLVADFGSALPSSPGASAAAGSTLEPLWPLAYVLCALAALAAVRTRPRAVVSPGQRHDSPRATVNLEWSRSARSVLPYLAFPAVAELLYLELRRRPTEPGFVAVLVLSGTIVVLAFLRQFLTLRENRELTRSLALLSHELETRVEERTSELTERSAELAAKTQQLTVLNQVATALSHCLTSDEALHSGLALAKDALGCDAASIWPCGPGEPRSRPGYPAVMAVGGVGSATAERPDDLLARVSDSQAPVWVRADEAQSGSGQRQDLVGLPLLSKGKVLGVLVLRGGPPQPWTATDLLLADSLSGQLGIALDNVQQYDVARYLADRDPLTGVLNHRLIHEHLEQEVSRAQRAGSTFSVIMMDLDDFKLFNDTYGHPIGDQVLRDVSTQLAANLRTVDTLGRYGGDEFIAILPNTSAAGAVELAGRLRDTLLQHPYPGEEAAVPIRLSYGIATYPDEARKANELIAFADANLYQSKRRGGDTVTVGGSTEAGEWRGVGIFGVLDGLVTAVNHKDRYTREHSEDVTDLALTLARAEGLSEESLRALRIAGLLHDVGKIGVPDGILRKPGPLTEAEFDVVKQHATLSELIIKEVPNLPEVLKAVGAHHERYDGAGYPRGLRGEEIPLLGRILAIADAYSAMTTHRPYRKARNPQEARDELLLGAGTQFDPQLVAQFLSVLEREELRVRVTA